MFDRWKKLRDENGFTLVETLVVIAVIGVLASVAVIAVGQTASDGRAAACRGDVNTVQTASDAYTVANGSPAANIAGLSAYLRDVPSRTVASDGYALTYSATDGRVGSDPANCAV